MDIEKLKDMLRNAAGGPVGIQMCQEAADALEQLQAENDRLRRERDAAVEKTSTEKYDYSKYSITRIFQGLNEKDLRFTRSNFDLCLSCTNGPLCPLFIGPCPTKLVYTKLSQYEDTGLAPEEVQQMRWIPVEERLPEKENAQVLMTDGEGWYISSRNEMVRLLDCEGIFIPGKAGAGVKVTHWMPLPKALKEEEK